MMLIFSVLWAVSSILEYSQAFTDNRVISMHDLIAQTVGNVLGLMQTNVKRILGYSSISHSGYMLIAVLVGPVEGGGPLRNGLSAALFYIVVYGLMNLGAFGVLALLRSRGKAAEELDDLGGLATLLDLYD